METSCPPSDDGGDDGDDDQSCSAGEQKAGVEPNCKCEATQGETLVIYGTITFYDD